MTPIVLVLGWLVAAAVQSRPYDPFQETISVLAGEGADHRWIMTLVLYAVAVLYLVVAAGLRSMAIAPRMIIAMAGIAGLGVASFPQPAGGSTFDHMSFAVSGAVLLTLWPFLWAFSRPAVPLFPADSDPPAQYDGWDRLLGRQGCIVMGVVIGLSALAMLVTAQYGQYLGAAERICTVLQALAPLVAVVGLWHFAAREAPDRAVGIGPGEGTDAPQAPRALPPSPGGRHHGTNTSSSPP